VKNTTCPRVLPSSDQDHLLRAACDDDSDVASEARAQLIATFDAHIGTKIRARVWRTEWQDDATQEARLSVLEAVRRGLSVKDTLRGTIWTLEVRP
jgi:hypothetical protein